MSLNPSLKRQRGIYSEILDPNNAAQLKVK